MTDLLEMYHKEIDAPDSGIGFNNNLANLAKEYATKLETQGETEKLKLLQLENEVHNIQKSVEGLQPMMKGTKEVNGKQVEFFVPDFTVYGAKEYDYIEKRYAETTNLFLKTEYGLLLYLNRRLQKNDQKLELCKHIIQLATTYKDAVFAHGEKWAIYVHALYTRLVDVLAILYRGGAPLKEELESFIQLIEGWFINMPVNHPAFISYSQFIAQTFADYRKNIKDIVNAQAILAKLDSGVQHNELLDLRCAILIAEKTLRFNQAYTLVDIKIYHEKLGHFYEREGDEQLEKHPFGAAKSYEDAILHFDKIDDDTNLKRVKKKYEDNKGKAQMGVVSIESDEEQSKMLTDWVAGIVERASPDEIISILCGHGLFLSAAKLEAAALKSSQDNLSVNLFTTYICDKYGNTLRIYDTPEKKLQYHRLQTVKFNHNFSIQMMFKILQRTMYEKIISYQHIKDFLEKSWLSQPIEWHSGGKIEKTIPLNAILPGIQNFFSEIEKRIADESHVPNMILSTDSLATKIEMLLRYMCKKGGIPTFRYIADAGHLLAEEKSLGDLIKELDGHLSPDDLMFIKYVINEKGGNNIRNQVAHGLVDAEEYGPATPLTLIAIIMRLSLYKISNTEANTNE